MRDQDLKPDNPTPPKELCVAAAVKSQHTASSFLRRWLIFALLGTLIAISSAGFFLGREAQAQVAPGTSQPAPALDTAGGGSEGATLGSSGGSGSGGGEAVQPSGGGGGTQSAPTLESTGGGGGSPVVKPVKDAVEPTVKPVLDPVKEAVDPVLNPVKETTDPLVEPVKNSVDAVNNPVFDSVKVATDPVARPVIDPVSKKPTEPTVKPIVSPVEETTDPVTNPVVDPVLGPSEPATPVQQADPVGAPIRQPDTLLDQTPGARGPVVEPRMAPAEPSTGSVVGPAAPAAPALRSEGSPVAGLILKEGSAAATSSAAPVSSSALTTLAQGTSSPGTPVPAPASELVNGPGGSSSSDGLMGVQQSSLGATAKSGLPMASILSAGERYSGFGSATYTVGDASKQLPGSSPFSGGALPAAPASGSTAGASSAGALGHDQDAILALLLMGLLGGKALWYARGFIKPHSVYGLLVHEPG